MNWWLIHVNYYIVEIFSSKMTQRAFQRFVMVSLSIAMHHRIPTPLTSFYTACHWVDFMFTLSWIVNLELKNLLNMAANKETWLSYNPPPFFFFTYLYSIYVKSVDICCKSHLLRYGYTLKALIMTYVYKILCTLGT